MKIRKCLALLLGVLLLLGMVGCAAEVVPSGDMAATAPANRNELATDVENSTGTALPENRKLIQTVNMDVETEDLDAVLQQIDSRIAELGGYVQSSYVQNGSSYSGKRYRSASVTVRVPAKDLDAFVDRVADMTNIVSSRKNVQDVTLSYVETEGRMKALQVEQERLLELLEKANTLDEILKIEDRLTKVRTELEQVTSALRTYDNQVDYATIYLSISEVTEYTETTEPESIWDRIGAGFADSWENIGIFFQELFVLLVVASPYMLLMGGTALTVVLIIRLSIRRKRKKEE